MLSGTSDCAVGGGGATAADFLAALFFVDFFAAFLVACFDDFLAAFLVAPFLAAAFFVPLPAFFADFLAAFTDFLAPPRYFDFDALFFVPLPAPLRAPLDFLVPFL